MPEIEIEINAETGEMETQIKGIAGPACEKTAEAIKSVFGKPSRDERGGFFRLHSPPWKEGLGEG